MTWRIWKTTLDPAADGPVVVVLGEILTVGPDPQADGKVAVWFDPTKAGSVKVRLVGTGHAIGNGWSIVGTAVIPPFAWHVVADRRD